MLDIKSERQAEIRQIESAILNFAGFGRETIIQPQELRLIPLLDNENKELPIRTRKRALELIERVMNKKTAIN